MLREVIGNLWEYPADWRVIPTNPDINRHGALVMGRGLALEAKTRYPGIEYMAAKLVTKYGNLAQVLSVGHKLILFPVKHHWHEQADLNLITTSAIDLAEIGRMLDCDTISLPRVGCGNGKLKWHEVKPVLEQTLDKRFVIVSRPQDV